MAADESSGTIKRRFDSINAESTEDNRRNYREMLFRTDDVEAWISGVILYDETARQKGVDGTPLVKVLSDRGIVPGIKVDKGTQPLAGSPGELITEGLDGLGQRLAEYYGMGLRFAKWRAVITVGEGIPTLYCIEANAHALARYAALSQHAGLVPIVEPEVLMDGDHGIDDCYAATKATLQETFAQLSPAESCVGRNAAEAQYGGLRFVGVESSGSGNGRRHDSRMFQTDDTGGDAGRRLSLWRTDRQRSDGKPECNQLGGCQGGRSVGAQLLVRPRPSERPLEGMGRKSGTAPLRPKPLSS